MKRPRRFHFPWRSRDIIDREVDAELEFHIDARTRALVAQGMTESAARQQAVREFGDINGTRAYCREQDSVLERDNRRHDRLGELRANVRLAFRSMRRNPGFTAVALLTLILAIGANTAIFSVANAVLYAPLPYSDPGRIVAVYENNTPTGVAQSDMSAADLVDYRRSQTSLTGLAMLARSGVLFRTAADDPVALQHLRVSTDMFSVLGARARYGRTFAAGEEGPPAAPVAMLTYDAWMRLFGGDTTAIGRTVYVNDQAMTLIGIMPSGFGLGYAEDVYTPLDPTPQLRDANRARKMHWLYAIGRLKPGVSIDAARDDLNRLARALEKDNPDANRGHLVTMLPIQAALAGSTVRSMHLLLAAAGVVLLIACVNLINMMLARAVARQREFTIRTAIGAGRAHLITQMVTETMVLATLGGGIGILAAGAATRAIVKLSPGALPVLAKPSLDWRVVVFSVAVTLIVGLVSGVVPALRMSRIDVGDALRRTGRGGDRRTTVLRDVFAVAQTAMAVMLLVVGGLLVRSLVNVRNVNMGFDPDNVLVGAAIVRGPNYQSVEGYNTFYDAVLERMRKLPGVVAVGAVAGVPLMGNSGCGLVIEGRAVPPGPPTQTRCGATRGDYFKTLGIPIIRGRNFNDADLPHGEQVVIVNAAMVKQFFANEDPIGKRIKLGLDPSAPWETIVGVVGDVRQASLEHEPVPTAYENDAQHGWGTLGVTVRVDGGDPKRLAPAFRAAVREADPSLAVRMIYTMDEIVGRQLAQRRLTMALIASFAGLALALAAIGVYGVLSHAVTARTREFGIRRALGASTASVRMSVLRRGVVWASIGLIVGGVGAGVLARTLTSMLFGVAPTDATTFAIAAAVVVAVTLIASLVPARRAVAVDPVLAMRAE